MGEQVPKDITSKYPRISRMKFPNGDVETVQVSKAFFVEDHNQEREYWKGFEIIEWSKGKEELRICYWTRKRGTKKWIWGQFSPIISLEKIWDLLKMLEKEKTK